MLKSVVARDKSWANLGSSIRLLCVLSKVNVIKKAESFLDVDDGMEDEYLVEDAYLLLLKVARHWVPSINYAVGLVMNMTLDITRPKHCVILSWDECFREEGSRQKWGLSFIPVTNKYRLNQPFYHIIQFETSHFWRIVLRGEAEKICIFLKNFCNCIMLAFITIWKCHPLMVLASILNYLTAVDMCRTPSTKHISQTIMRLLYP
ncbi:hypothetical protein DAPPUDRAFT_123533 [Daphnia pulex]|uniref:Uncharacterized protein n=1 Tax=Daphnia pulex TaxID=6669 RepID=E9I5V4_DAPPU|nr:hypothetical protein DAPPUDRAFT_123533 [Daphnia pulex]|eukprot:EFX60626.1 hypothetical protein DAPPUDRAFT_123533 [Daphnia pulex]